MDGEESDLEDEAHLQHLSRARDAFARRQEPPEHRTPAPALLPPGTRCAAAPALRQQQQQLAGELEHQQQVRHRRQAEAQHSRPAHTAAVVPTHCLLALCSASGSAYASSLPAATATGTTTASTTQVVPPVDISRTVKPLERRTPLLRAWTEDEELRLLQGVVQYGESLLLLLL